MQVIDKRGIPLTTTFGDLKVGDAFQDDDGDICIKTDTHTAIYWEDGTSDGGSWFHHRSFSERDLIIPLSVTYTFERKRE